MHCRLRSLSAPSGLVAVAFLRLLRSVIRFVYRSDIYHARFEPFYNHHSSCCDRISPGVSGVRSATQKWPFSKLWCRGQWPAVSWLNEGTS
ncbi:hypothetical protein BDV33DRAFT_167637 [Aspergillus novoparasiticus]|uniref:Uncharacterized protein n=1 Tax=Aspergillus novoparasiticus TaxID=986946 RepID=A0A5N6F0C7_9EURO|nr:hypothetical protein BDV33DRAFT_167637 [Aspergillus novoparasiticus]